MIVAAADGSSLANPGPSGWAWYIDDAHWAAGGWAKGTNNMGELMSVLDLLRATRQVDEPLRILCDSQYVINCCTRWIPAWKKRGWRKTDNKPVLNLDLIQQLAEQLAGRRVTFQWVRGHTGHALNEKADQLARAAAVAYQQGTPVAYGPGFSKAPVVAAAPDDDPDPALGPEVPVAPSGEPSLVPLPIEIPSPEFPVLVPMVDVVSSRTVEMAGEAPRSPAGLAQVVDITELTRELLSDDTQLDRDRLAELMHRDYVAHLPGGLIRTKGSIMARGADLSGPIQISVLGADLLAENLILLRYKLKRNSQDHLCAILWQHADPGWQARFHQISLT